jgi:polyisoprenoid-binding protein YceI
MATWVFEPGHTAAEFHARHMMVSWVRGHIKDVHGSLEFDPDNPARLSIQATLDANKLWTGEPQRDNHLRSSDFLDAGQHPTLSFKSTGSKCVGPNHARRPNRQPRPYFRAGGSGARSPGFVKSGPGTACHFIGP